MNINGNNKGFTFIDGLQLLFIGLKLSGHIDWCWGLVMLPLEIVTGLAILSLAARGGER